MNSVFEYNILPLAKFVNYNYQKSFVPIRYMTGDSKNNVNIEKLHEEIKTSTNDSNDEPFLIRMHGLPFKATEQEIKDFFLPETKCKEVKFSYGRNGSFSGNAIVSFEDEESLQIAMKKDKQHIGSRYINLHVYSAEKAARMSESDEHNFLLRMQGCPFEATEKEIADFFLPETKCKGIDLIKNSNGNFSGVAIVSFEDEEALQIAMKKDKQYIGSRYVNLRLYSAEKPAKKK